MRGFIAGACVNLGTRSCPFFVGFSAGFLYRRPGGGFFARCRSHPLGVLLAIRARKFRRTGNTGCREAPPARRTRWVFCWGFLGLRVDIARFECRAAPQGLLLGLRRKMQREIPRATAGVGNRPNNRELFGRFPPARGQRRFFSSVRPMPSAGRHRPSGAPVGCFAGVISV